jgi:hypothetical protein
LLHHRGVLFGREAFGRVGVDFAWNVHVVKIGDSGARNLPGPPFYRVRSEAGQNLYGHERRRKEDLSAASLNAC